MVHQLDLHHPMHKNSKASSVSKWMNPTNANHEGVHTPTLMIWLLFRLQEDFCFLPFVLLSMESAVAVALMFWEELPSRVPNPTQSPWPGTQTWRDEEKPALFIRQRGFAYKGGNAWELRTAVLGFSCNNLEASDLPLTLSSDGIASLCCFYGVWLKQ